MTKNVTYVCDNCGEPAELGGSFLSVEYTPKNVKLGDRVVIRMEVDRFFLSHQKGDTPDLCLRCKRLMLSALAASHIK